MQTNLVTNTRVLFAPLLSIFIKTHLVLQESVILSKCCILKNMTILASNAILFFKKMVYFNINYNFCVHHEDTYV